MASVDKNPIMLQVPRNCGWNLGHCLSCGFVNLSEVQVNVPKPFHEIKMKITLEFTIWIFFLQLSKNNFISSFHNRSFDHTYGWLNFVIANWSLFEHVSVYICVCLYHLPLQTKTLTFN